MRKIIKFLCCLVLGLTFLNPIEVKADLINNAGGPTLGTAKTITVAKYSEGTDGYYFKANESTNLHYYKFTVTDEDVKGGGTYFYFTFNNVSISDNVTIILTKGTSNTIFGSESWLAESSINQGKSYTNGRWLEKGTYYLKLDTKYKSGEFTFNVEKQIDDTPDDSSGAATLKVGQKYTKKFDGPGDVDWFKFKATSNTMIISITNINSDTYLNGYLRDSSLNIVKFDNVSDNYYWSSTDKGEFSVRKGNTAVATYTLTKGKTYYLEHSLDNSGYWDVKYQIHVAAKTITPTKVSLNKTKATIYKGKTLQLKATVSPSDATNKAVTWKSSNTKVATVSSTGKVTAKAAGTATITCTTKSGSKKATAKITVKLTKEQGINEFVERCYTKALGRKSEKNGKKYWVDRILKASNTKAEALKTARDGFFNSTEFLNKKTSNTEFVKICYRTFMGREAEKNGLKYWVDLLNSKKKTRNQVLQEFAYSKEFSNIMASYGIK